MSPTDRSLPDQLGIPAFMASSVLDLIEASSISNHLEWTTYPDDSIYLWVSGGMPTECWSTGEQELWKFLASFCGYPTDLAGVIRYFAGNDLAPLLTGVFHQALNPHARVMA